MWGEPGWRLYACEHKRISTHSPRVGRTTAHAPINSTMRAFQLTRPVWGEPVTDVLIIRFGHNFNSLAPCGANLLVVRYGHLYKRISTHSPRVGRTLSPCPRRFVICYFNSLAPCGANRNRRADNQVRTQFQLTRPVWGEPQRRFVACL